MYCTQLLEIKELNDIQRESFDSFFFDFLPNGYITVSKAVEFTGMQESVVAEVFSKLYLCGYLDIVYAVSCPECGHLIKKIENKKYFDYGSLNYCYACEEGIEISDADIVTLFVKKERNPFVRGQYLNNEFVTKQDVGIARNDTVEYLKSISQCFASIIDMQESRFGREDRKNEELNYIKNKAYKRYRHNKKIYLTTSNIFRIILLVILLFVLCISEVQGKASVFVTVAIYAFQNVIDVLLKSYIVTDLNEIEREEMYFESKEK